MVAHTHYVAAEKGNTCWLNSFKIDTFQRDYVIHLIC